MGPLRKGIPCYDIDLEFAVFSYVQYLFGRAGLILKTPASNADP